MSRLGKIIRAVFIAAMIALSGLALAIFALSGCTDTNTGSILVSDTAPAGGSDFFSQNRGTYVGDNSAVGAIINHLDSLQLWENSIDNFALSTSAAPFGIVINQSGMETEPNSWQVMSPDAPSNIQNAAFIMALVENADWVEFHIPVHPCPAPPTVCLFDYRVNRSDIENKLNAPLSSFNTEAALHDALTVVIEQ